MAIVVDPDFLSRADVIFGTAAQQISIYPVGETERNGDGVEYTDVFVSTIGEITTGLGSFAAAVPGDVVAIQNNVDAGHYYVETETTPAMTLAEIDTGTGGAETTGLSIQTSVAFDGTTDIDDALEEITIATHGYVTGDAVVYDRVGGTLVTGLTDLTAYYIIRVDASTIALATTYALAIAGTRINLTDTATSANNVLHDRLIVQIFTNGANAGEQISGNPTGGDGLGDVRDGITQQAVYSFGKEEWRVDSQITDVDNDHYNDDLIRHQFPFEAITSEQFEVGGGTSHDNWNWFNLYTRKKVRTAGWAEKTDVGTGDLARETGVITLGSIDADAQVYYQQTSIVTAKADFTFLGPVNEALNVYADASADNTPEDDFTTFLKLFVRKKGRSYTGSTIADIGVSTIQTIVNRFPLAHVIDTGITLTDGNLLGADPYSFATTPVAIDSGADGDKTINQLTFTAGATDFAAIGVVAGDILHITEAADADGPDNYYEISDVSTVTITIKELESVSGNDFAFQTTGWLATNATTDYEILTSVLTPAPATTTLRDTGTLVDGTATGLVDVDSATGTLTDAGGVNFTTDGVAAGDIVIISQFFDISFDGVADVGTDLITEATHNLRTGDRVIYDQNSRVTEIGGLVDLDLYYVSVASTSTFYMCATLADAWSRANGGSTQITLSDGEAGAHLLHVHEGDGYYPVTNVAATILTVDTTDFQFPTTDKAIGTFYRVVEAGMYLQFKDKTVGQQSQTQTTLPLTDLNFVVTGGPTYTIDISGGSALGFDYLDDAGGTVSVQAGDMIEFTGTTLNDGRYTVVSRTDAQTIVVLETILADVADHAGVTIDIKRGFERTLGVTDVSFNWKVSGNGGSLNQVFEVVQEQLRSDLDIDKGPGTFVPATNSGLVGFIGNINDLLMTFAAPTGVGLNLIIDSLSANDINNSTFNDHAGNAQNFPFTSAGSLVFNPNLTNDDNSKYWLFFTNDDAPGDDLGRDYGSENAIIVDDATTPTANPITGFVNAAGGDTHQGGGTGRSVSAGTTSITFTYAYDTNLQRGSGSGTSTAPVTLVAIGAPTAQFVIATGNITAATGITISAVAALERNYNGAL